MRAHSSRGMFGKMTIKEERNVFNWCPNVCACKSEQSLSGLLSKLHLKLLMQQDSINISYILCKHIQMVAFSLIFTFNGQYYHMLIVISAIFFNIQVHKPSTKFILMDTQRLNIGWFSFAVCQLSNSVHLRIRPCMNCDQEPPNLHTG